MTIAEIEAIPIAYPEPNDAGRTRHLCLVRVRDENGRRAPRVVRVAAFRLLEVKRRQVMY